MNVCANHFHHILEHMSVFTQRFKHYILEKKEKPSGHQTMKLEKSMSFHGGKLSFKWNQREAGQSMWPYELDEQDQLHFGILQRPIQWGGWNGILRLSIEHSSPSNISHEIQHIPNLHKGQKKEQECVLFLLSLPQTSTLISFAIFICWKCLYPALQPLFFMFVLHTLEVMLTKYYGYKIYSFQLYFEYKPVYFFVGAIIAQIGSGQIGSRSDQDLLQFVSFPLKL